MAQTLRTLVSALMFGCVSLSIFGCGPGGDVPNPDTLLTEYFCGLYYPTGSAAAGLPACETVRNAVKSDMSTALPTLSLGDPAKPALFFVHGWPDSAAEFAAQFGGLCFGPDAKYYCVAATWQNFHPDVLDAPLSELGLQNTIDKLVATMTAANLADTTFVIHDWGSFIGYQLMWQHPSLVKRCISFDIGSGGSPNTTYQDENVRAWETQDSGPSMDSARYWQAPCIQCAPWRSTWPYVTSIAQAGLNVSAGSPATMPLLFMYGNLTRGMPRESDSFFFNDAWLDFVRSTPHGEVLEVEGDHWFFHQSPKVVNEAIDAWISGQQLAQREGGDAGGLFAA